MGSSVALGSNISLLSAQRSTLRKIDIRYPGLQLETSFYNLEVFEDSDFEVYRIPRWY
jgi:hypothetical protein